MAVSDQQSDAESKQATVIAVAIVFASLSAIVVSLRLYTRQFILRAAGADDWTMLAATVCMSQPLPSRVALSSRLGLITLSFPGPGSWSRYWYYSWYYSRLHKARKAQS